MPENTDTDKLDPTVAAELDRLEDALNGVSSADPELLALVAAVRVQSTGIRPQFRRELDERAAAGFPRGGGRRAWTSRLSLPSLKLGPALGLAAAVVVALVVSVGALDGVGGSDDEFAPYSLAVPESAPSSATTADDATVPEAAAGTAQEVAPLRSRPAAPSAVAPPQSVPRALPSGVATKTPSFGRKVEGTTRLSLSTSTHKLQEVADGVVRVTQSAGGVVEQSSVDATDRGGTASFMLSVPTAKAGDTVKRLSALAHVASMSQAATDITSSFVSAIDRLSDARAERRALLSALKGAKTPEGIARLRDRIRANRREIASLKGQLNGLRDRADNTVLSVSLAGRGAVDKGDDGAAGGRWSPGDAAGDALRVLEVAAGVLLIALAVAVPLALLGAPAWLGARAARRRRREHALDAA